MGFTAVQMKLMPTSPDVNLQEIEKKAEEIINSKFTPLFTTKSKGQGLGLVFIKRLVEAWNSEIASKGQQNK